MGIQVSGTNGLAIYDPIKRVFETVRRELLKRDWNHTCEQLDGVAELMCRQTTYSGGAYAATWIVCAVWFTALPPSDIARASDCRNRKYSYQKTRQLLHRSRPYHSLRKSTCELGEVVAAGASVFSFRKWCFGERKNSHVRTYPCMHVARAFFFEGGSDRDERKRRAHVMVIVDDTSRIFVDGDRKKADVCMQPTFSTLHVFIGNAADTIAA
jgi:hypothetical protein